MSRSHLFRPLRQPLKFSTPFSTTSPPLSSQYQATNPSNRKVDPHNLLSKPTWSISSFLPPSSSSTPSPSDQSSPPTPAISPSQLSHLLKLSALPPSPESHSKILSDLHSQLHFLAHLQSVNTDNISPLSSIRDETPEGLSEAAITVDTLKEALSNEDQVGKWRRPRRRVESAREQREVEKWDVLGAANEKVTVGGGGYFVVRSGKVVAAE